MSKHAKHHSLHGEVGNFFPAHHEGFAVTLVISNVDVGQNYTHKYAGNVVLRFVNII